MTIRFALAYLALTGLFFLPLSCAKDVPTSAYAGPAECRKPDCRLASDTCKPPACYTDPRPPRGP